MYSQSCEVGCQFHLLLNFCSGCQVRCWQPRRAQFSVLSSDRGHCNLTLTAKEELTLPIQLIALFSLTGFLWFQNSS